MMKVKLEKYKWWHSFNFFFGLLDIQALKFAGVFRRKFLKNFVVSFFDKGKKDFLKFSIFVDGKIVGGLDIVKVSKGNYNIGIIIFRKYRKVDIATTSVKKAFSIAKKMGAKKITGTNNKDNFASIKLVRKLGYKKVKETGEKNFWEKKL